MVRDLIYVFLFNSWYSDITVGFRSHYAAFCSTFEIHVDKAQDAVYVLTFYADCVYDAVLLENDSMLADSRDKPQCPPVRISKDTTRACLQFGGGRTVGQSIYSRLIYCKSL